MAAVVRQSIMSMSLGMCRNVSTNVHSCMMEKMIKYAIETLVSTLLMMCLLGQKK